MVKGIKVLWKVRSYSGTKERVMLVGVCTTCNMQVKVRSPGKKKARLRCWANAHRMTA